MTRKDAFTKIKELLGLEPQKFEQAKTAEGVVIVWDGELGTGTPLFVIDEAGTQQAAPDGEHTLEDGTVVTTAGGLVVTVAPKEQDGGEEMTAKKLKDLEAKFADGVVDISSLSIMVKALMNYCYGWEMQEVGRKEAVDQAISVYKESFAAIIADSETITSKLESYEQKFTEISEAITNTEKTVESKFTAIKEVVESIAAEPAVEPTQPAKTSFSKSTNTVEELYKNIKKIKE